MSTVTIIARTTLHTIGFACGAVGAYTIIRATETHVARNRAAARKLAAMDALKRLS